MLDIRISCTDNGIPTQTTIKDFKIYLNDVNDVPFNLTLSNSTINETAPIGAKIGQFSGMDEDVSQTLTFSLVNNSSYFYIDTENNLRKKGNFSTTKYLYKVLVKAEDNGSPSMKVRTLQKQSLRGVPRKRCSENIQQMYRRIPMPKCDFNKLVCNFIEITLLHGWSRVNLLHIFAAPFLKNILDGCF